MSLSIYRPLLHRGCGGEIVRAVTAPWRCLKCKSAFGNAYTMTRTQIADRFVQAPEPDHGTYAVVWKTEGKKRFATLVSAADAWNDPDLEMVKP